ncbi:MAG TPA: CoA-transferase, partial [Tepidisphaeraceae bacterium]|nr:CoA-transferase [Tepidisphaeraceae bacterium]
MTAFAPPHPAPPAKPDPVAPPGKVITAEQAARLVRNRAFVAIQGSGGGVGEPTRLLRAIRQRFDAEHAPTGLTLCHATGLGDRKEIGTDLLAVPGLVERDIAGHLGMAPAMGRMILAEQIESYNFPQGVLSQMYGAIAGRKPGVFTKVGLHTFVDPRVEGGRMNARTTEELVRVVTLDGQDWLFFPAFRVDVALVRGTTADERGNITSEQEAAILEGIAIAQAAKACGGIVIAQVKYLAQHRSLDPRRVRIPGVVVDHVVVDP